MRPRRSLTARLDRLTGGNALRSIPAFLAYARAVIAFGGSAPSPASSEALARWLAGHWREGA